MWAWNILKLRVTALEFLSECGSEIQWRYLGFHSSSFLEIMSKTMKIPCRIFRTQVSFEKGNCLTDSRIVAAWANLLDNSYTRVVPKVMRNFFFACELGTAEEGECGDRWNQLLCYPWVSCDVNSLHHVTSIIPNKMADNHMSFRQRAVIEFLVKEDIPAAEIHQRLQRAYGSVCMGASSVRR